MTARGGKVGALALDFVQQCRALAHDEMDGATWLRADADLRALLAERDAARAECARLRAALADCAHRASRLMGSLGYLEEGGSEWIGPDMHAIVDHAAAAAARDQWNGGAA